MKTFKRHFPLCLTVGAIVILWTLIVGLRTANARTLMTSRLTQQRERLAELQSQLQQLQTQQDRERDLRERCAAYQRQLPTLETRDATVASIKQLAEVNALAIEPVKLMTAPPTPGVTCRAMRFDVHGSFNAFYAFLTQLETLSPSLLVQGFELKRSGGTDADLSASVTVEMLFRTSSSANESTATVGVMQ